MEKAITYIKCGQKWRNCCDRQLYTMEKGRNMFGISSPLPNLIVNDMHSNLSLFILLLYHSEASKSIKRMQLSVNNTTPRMFHRDPVVWTHQETPRSLIVLLDPSSYSSWCPLTSLHPIPNQNDTVPDLIQTCGSGLQTPLCRTALDISTWLWHGAHHFQGQSVMEEEKGVAGCTLCNNQF